MLPTRSRPRRWWVASCVVAVATSGLAAPAPVVADRDGRTPPRPNVVVVLVDDMRADQLRFLPRTRRLVGDRGTTYTRAISPHPLCCPARASLITGQYTQNHGVQSNFPPTGGFPALGRPGNTIGRWMARAGYRTGWIGKFLNEYRTEHGRQRGWHTWDPLVRNLYTYRDPVFFGDARPTRGHVTTILRRRTDRFLEDRSRRPMFLVVGHVAPHGALRRGRWVAPVATAPHRGAYRHLRPSSFRKPSYAERAVGDLPPDLRVRQPSRSYLRAFARGAARSLRSVDDAVAGVISRLRRSGELSSTYVVVTSDNGFLLGEHRIVDKDVLFDEALDVPLLVRGPGVPAGVTDRTPVTLVDLVASILSWTGARPGRRIDGIPLANADGRDTILIQTGAPERSHGGWAFRGVTTDRYLYARRAGHARQGLLFDRARDPYALRNRYGDRRYRAVQRELARRTSVLGGCAGATACNRTFGPVPAPAALTGPAAPTAPRNAGS